MRFDKAPGFLSRPSLLAVASVAVLTLLVAIADWLHSGHTDLLVLLVVAAATALAFRLGQKLGTSAVAGRDVEARLLALSVDKLHSSVFWSDRLGRVIYANDQACRNLGFERSELLGMHIWDFDPDFGNENWSERWEHLKKSGSVSLESRHRRKDGTLVPIKINTFHIALDGEEFAFVFTDDLSEHEDIQRELQMLHAAVHSSHTPIFSISPQSQIVYANEFACSSLGYSREELLGRHTWDIDPDFRPEHQPPFWQSLKNAGSLRFEVNHRRKDGSRVPVEIVATYFSFKGEEFSLCIGQDISERLQAAETLKRLNEDLEDRVEHRTAELLKAKEEADRANLAKSDFLSRMSHELRTPLNAILGFGQLLESDTDSPLSEEQRDGVHEILHAGSHLLELINEVLDLARVEAGKLTVSNEPLQLAPLVEECLTLIRPLAESNRVRIVESARECTAHVRADRTRLKQVLLNLLSNAVKYNRERGSVSIACMPRGSELEIRIIDTGAGLSIEQQQRLFKPFERLDQDNKGIEGTGIGLALSKRLMELMHGHIGVDSSPQVGSSFWIRIPIAEPAQLNQPSADDHSIEEPVRSRATVQRDVLCIEDNPANMRLIEAIIDRRADLRLLCANHPSLGLELARTHRPALILLDINLPEMDGFAVMECLRTAESTRDIPVVAISANAMPKDLERGKAAGFSAYLTKPIDTQKLLNQIDQILEA